MPVPSKIFTGFRALGFVSNHVPLVVRYHHKHKENYIVTCVGKSFHTYNCSRLGIISVSDSHQDDISATAVDRDLTFTACGNVVRAFVRGKQVIHVYEGHTANVYLLLPFGKHLISIDTNSTVIIWDIKSEGKYTEIPFNNESFQITTVTHPSTYLNKILFGSKQGRLELWNIRKNSLIYTFPGWGHPVTAVEQAPAVDVVAIGLANGQIFLHNLKFDETITKFLQDWGPVTTISFRTDGHPIMATGSAAGHIALWDLEERKLKSQMRNAHSSTVSGMQCLPSEPLMVTSSADNTLKVWIFDKPDGGGRLLRERSGHSAPSNKLRHYGTDGQNILTAGQDSTMRSFSTVHDKHNKSLGRASYNKQQTKKNSLKFDQHKMPYIVDFVAEPTRQSDWDNILACHRGLRMVTTWSYQKSTMGQHKFDHQRFTTNTAKYQHTVAQCVEITLCGNFGLIGYSSGHIDMYNLQSGKYRGSFTDLQKGDSGDSKAHSSCVHGVCVDGINQVAASAGRDGDIKFWKFKEKQLLDTCKLNSTVSKLLLHRESSMLAIAQDDFQVFIIDIDTRKIVRKFSGHDNRITDMAFSADARWLITSGMDCSLKVWDLPTGRLIDCFLVDSAVVSLSLSPTYDFLATCHLDDLGVYLWANKTLYAHVPLTGLPADYEPQMIEMPSSKSQSAGEGVDGECSIEEEQEFIRAEFKSAEQISNELITLSLLPNSRWQNLLNLDIIKQRNKPKEPPKAPKAAPFFLPTIAGLDPKFASEEETTNKVSKSKIEAGNLLPLCTLGQLLKEASSNSSYDKVIDYMKTLGPSAIDLEIRSLAPELGGSVPVMANFLQFVQSVLQTNKNFEIIQAYLGLFLKVHSDLLSSEAKLVRELETLSDLQSTSCSTVQDLFNQSLCLVNYLRTAVV